MRSLILAPLLAVIAAPALCLTVPAAPQTAQTKQEPLRALPADWLDDADLSDGQAGAEQREAARSQATARETGAQRAETGTDDCRPSSGTTGLVVGAVAGGLLGRAIDGGDRSAVGTILGAGGGALLGREVEKRRSCK